MIHVLLNLALLAAPSRQTDPEFSWDCPATGYLPCRAELLVSTDRLARMIDEDAVTTVHVGFDESAGPGLRRARCEDGRLPGALFLGWTDLAWVGISKREPQLHSL